MRLAATVMMVVALVSIVAVRSASAEAESTRVILSYVPVVSNWGPAEANGVVVYTLAEGDVRADLVGLPVLGDDQRYELWLRSSASGEQYSLARFNAVNTGTTFVDALLPEAIPADGWDEVRITVEPEPDTDPAPSDQLAIVGGVPGTVAETQQFPPVMPETGEAAPTASVSSGPKMLIATATVALGLLVSATALIRERRRMTRLDTALVSSSTTRG